MKEFSHAGMTPQFGRHGYLSPHHPFERTSRFARWQDWVMLSRPCLARRCGWGDNSLVLIPAGETVSIHGRDRMAGTNFDHGGAAYVAERVE